MTHSRQGADLRAADEYVKRIVLDTDRRSPTAEDLRRAFLQGWHEKADRDARIREGKEVDR